MSFGRRELEITVAAIAAAALYALFVGPLFATGWSGDDIFNSTINARLSVEHASFGQVLREINGSWIQQGRFFPLTLAYTYSVLHIFNSISAYKCFEITWLSINAITFYCLVRYLTNEARSAILAVLLLPAVFQLRVYNDAYLGFATLLPAVFEMLMLSLFFFIVSVRSNSGIFWFLSILIYCISLLTYEISYLFFVAFIALGFRFRRLLMSLPFAMCAACMTAVSVLLRSHAPRLTAENSYAIHSDFGAYARTLGYQLAGALPVTYATFDPWHFLPPIPRLVAHLDFGLLLAILIFVAVATRTLFISSSSTETRADLRTLSILGVAFWILPAILIPLSGKYQREITPGLAHLPVYIETFGVVMLTTWAAIAVRSKVKRGVLRRYCYICFASILIAILIITYGANARVLAHNEREREARANFDFTVQSGLLHVLPANSVLFVDSETVLEKFSDQLRDAISAGANVPLSVRSLQTCLDNSCTPEVGSYVLVASGDDKIGVAFLGRVRHVSRMPGRRRIYVDRLRLFLHESAGAMKLGISGLAMVHAIGISCLVCSAQWWSEHLETFSESRVANGELLDRLDSWPLPDVRSLSIAPSIAVKAARI